MNHIFPMNNKLAEKQFLKNAEITSTVAEEQHRSRKNHQAGLLALNKCLIGNLLRIMIKVSVMQWTTKLDALTE